MIELIGHKVISVEESTNDYGYYKITTDKEIFYYQDVVECCNTLYIEWIDLDNLIGNVVYSVEEKECISSDEGTVETFGYTIKSLGGYTDVVIRNENRGQIWYKGSLEKIDDPGIEEWT